MSNVVKELINQAQEEVPEKVMRAVYLHSKGELDEALRVVSQHLNDNFDDVPALIVAAEIHKDAGRNGLAQAILKHAARIKPDIAHIWNVLGLCYNEGNDLEEAEQYFYRALKIAPDDAFIHNNLGQLFHVTAQQGLALKHLNRAIQLDPTLAEAYYNRALVHLAQREWKDGWKDYDAKFGTGMLNTRRERTYGIIPRWNGKEGKNIIAYGEQGVGDEIAFASCIPDLMKQNKVTIECAKGLESLFKRSFPECEVHGTRHDRQIPWLQDKDGKLRKFDAAVAFGSLPRFYRNADSDFPGTPYLKPDPERRIQWRALLDSMDKKLKVGIAWTGGTKKAGKHRRSLPLVDMLPILRQDATFVSLQYMPAPEIAEIERNYGIKIHHWPHAVNTANYDDTAALVAELDLVVSVTTAVIHLCGAIGKECWVLSPKWPRWFYGMDTPDLPWYKSVKLYRQKGEWVNSVADIGTDLRNRINGKT